MAHMPKEQTNELNQLIADLRAALSPYARSPSEPVQALITGLTALINFAEKSGKPS